MESYTLNFERRKLEAIRKALNEEIKKEKGKDLGEWKAFKRQILKTLSAGANMPIGRHFMPGI